MKTKDDITLVSPCGGTAETALPTKSRMTPLGAKCLSKNSTGTAFPVRDAGRLRDAASLLRARAKPMPAQPGAATTSALSALNSRALN